MNKKNRTSNEILIIVPSLSFGGAEKVAINLANTYAKNGIKTHLACFNTRGGYKEQIHENVDLIDLNISRTIYSFKKLTKLINEIKPTLIISAITETNIILGLLSFILTVPKMLFRQANTMDLINSKSFLIRYMYKILMKITYGRATKVIANSEDTANDLVHNNIIKRSEIEVIDNPVLPDNVEDLGSKTNSHPWLQDKSLDILLSVGRLTYQKNHELLINAFSLLKTECPNLRLIILGKGELLPDLTAQISKLEINGAVDIVEPISNPYPFYKRAKVFALTSRYEGFGNVIVEAMAFGNSLVCTNCNGGPKFLLEQGNLGLLVESSMPVDFANAIRKQLATPMAPKALLVEKSKQYRADIIAEKYLKASNT